MDANYVIALMHVIDKQTTLADLHALGERIGIDRQRYGVDAESMNAIRSYYTNHKAKLEAEATNV